MRLYLLLAVFLLSILPASALAVDTNITLNDVVETLEKPFRAETPANAAIHDFAADFSQFSTLEVLDREQRGHGRVEVRFPPPAGSQQPVAQFRWRYFQPNDQKLDSYGATLLQEIVSDGTTLSVFVPENNQVIQSEIDASKAAGADDPLTFLTGLGNLSRDFLISWVAPEPDHTGAYELLLKPRQASALIKQLQIVVDHDAVMDLVRRNQTGRRWPIVSSTVTDPNRNTTRFEFSNCQVNTGLSASAFNFKPPAGVNVVHPTGPGQGN